MQNKEFSAVPLKDKLVSDLIFPTAVWRKETSYDNSQLKEYINNLMKSSNGTIISNYGGWQSDRVLGGLPKEFSELQEHIDSSIRQICFDTNLPPIKLDNLWYNVNTPGSYNMIHNHPGCVLSGVYYVDVPEENMGDIEFHRSDDSQYYLHDNINTFFGSDRFIYKAMTGVLLLFPSWLKHSVQGNLSKKNRISLSFNYTWR